MTENQLLWRVEIPQAMPVIVAGIRTATVWVVGMATLSTPVGAPSLGNFIFGGLQTRNFDAVLMGCIGSAGLALTLDGLIRSIEVGVRERRRVILAASVTAIGFMYAFVGVTMVAGKIGAGGTVVVVGAKTFTESFILAEAAAQKLESDAGLRTRQLQSLGSTVAFDALRTSELDVYVDYSGTIWATIMKNDDPPPKGMDLTAVVADYLRTEHEITLVSRLGFENTYAMAMRRTHAEELGITKISELAVHAPKLVMGGDYEFFARPEWRQIHETYQLAFSARKTMDPSLMYQAVATSQVDVISAFSTDGRIRAFDLVNLEDDRGAIPPYDAIILASPRLSNEFPEAIEVLRSMNDSLDEEKMTEMNFQVDEEHRAIADVAADYLRSIN